MKNLSAYLQAERKKPTLGTYPKGVEILANKGSSYSAYLDTPMSHQYQLPPYLQEHWTVQQLLGEGAVARVLAVSPRYRPETQYAFKWLQLGYTLPAQREEVTQQFSHEVRILSQLNHLGIPKLLEDWTHHKSPGFLIEHRGTNNLRQLQELVGPIHLLKPWLAIALQLAEIMEYVHRRGYLYLDLKPENIVINRYGSLSLIDFGVTRLIKTNAPQSNFGTPGYAPPEQYHSQPLTPAADIFSFGVVLYELWSGQQPKPDLKLELPTPLMEVLQPCIAQNPTDRPQSFTALITQLKQLINQQSDSYETQSLWSQLRYLQALGSVVL